MTFIQETGNAAAGSPGDRRIDLLRLDMHVHSAYSLDSMVSIDALVRAWRKNRVLSLVCDHDSIEGSRRAYTRIREIDPDIPLILAEEITTDDGEIIGVFLTEEIRPGMSAAETLDTIRDQGALAVVPHPFCTFRSTAIRRETLYEIIDRIDIVEGFNARNPSPAENDLAAAYAQELGKPISAGSDAHLPYELSRTYVEIPLFDDPKTLLTALDGASATIRRAHPVNRHLSKVVQRVKEAAGHPSRS
ncbi:PHP domain-containing protein [Methanoculleus taiwanensis]|uniref:PHP domain-containing protein n=1 Tax=Methanoculleus taiwanensis TaxID=1550565 RepID=UPI000FFE385D|nr:PHP domain-containing protein [Methanoculleus taiwanensis]